eukprot:1556711-Rhodomonas_salina.2
MNSTLATQTAPPSFQPNLSVSVNKSEISGGGHWITEAMECAFAPHAESDYDSLLDRYIEAVNHGHDQHGKGNIAFHRSLLIERVGRDPSQRSDLPFQRARSSLQNT